MRCCMRLVAVVFVLALVSLRQLPVAGQADAPLLLDQVGRWTLSELGYGEMVLGPQDKQGATAVRYQLPEDAQQGPDRWYLLHLHFRIEFEPDSGDGFAYVSAFTNEKAVSQVKFTTVRRDGALEVLQSSVSSAQARVRQSTSDTTIDTTYTNLMQTTGVLPGFNTLTFGVEQIGNAAVRQVTIWPDSIVEISSSGPAKIKLDVDITKEQVVVGDTFMLHVMVSGSAPHEVGTIQLKALYPEDSLELSGAPTQSVTLGGDGQGHGMFTFRALRAGQHQVLVHARSAINNPMAMVVVTVTDSAVQPPDSRGRNLLVWGGIGLAALCLGGGVMVGRVKRHT
jgi:hypothetical protein